MASIFKQLTSNDVASTKTLLHEAIPLTGTIVSGTYSDNNIKNYAHGMFQSVYDYPFLSSSANHIFDITFGYANSSPLSSSTNTQNAKKINIYNQMAQVLVGYDKTGSVQLFDQDGDFFGTTTDKMKEVIFINFSRLLSKDEVKKGSFQLEIGTKSAFAQDGTVFTERIQITDANGDSSYLVNSPAGEYGILFATQSAGTDILKSNASFQVGLIYYQAGVAVVSGSIFNDEAKGGILNNSKNHSIMTSTGIDFNQLLTGSAISASADALRTRFFNTQFNNTVELNSTIYFCRANHNEFNYSANPTYLSGSTINVN